eukprot:2823512-Heterocapsa_arctica.AAC.1
MGDHTGRPHWETTLWDLTGRQRESTGCHGRLTMGSNGVHGRPRETTGAQGRLNWDTAGGNFKSPPPSLSP